MSTGIDYLTEAWNPIAMCCTPVSPGCAHCWHLAMCKRLAGKKALPATVRRAYAGGPPVLVPDTLAAPLHWRKPRRIGVQFMGDWLHESVRVTWLSQMFGVMGAAPEHRFLTLTKRIERYSSLGKLAALDLPNHWNGASACNQSELDASIVWLRVVRTRHRWVSLEPLLEYVELPDLTGIDWVVVGCETGAGARRCSLHAIAWIVEQCGEQHVPVYVKAVSDGEEIVSDRADIGRVLIRHPASIRQMPDALRLPGEQP